MAEGRWLARAARDRRMRGGLVILGVLALTALMAPWLSPYDPAAQPDPVGLKLHAPSLAHPLGTDPFSRDVLSRLLAGSGVSLSIALGAAAIALFVGTSWGALAGWQGGRLDGAMMRIVDAGLGLPRVLLLVLVLALWGSLTPASLALVLGLTGWFVTSRLVRAEVRAAKSLPHVLAARALGATDWRVFRVHILPAAVGPALVASALGASHVLVLEAGLAVIGLGLAPPAASWGSVLYDGFTDLRLYWWLVVFPGAAILLASAACTAVADALREAADPRTPPEP
jgi:ABC-type dipeptide/oligopeptide/nickel transport system permease subunit